MVFGQQRSQVHLRHFRAELHWVICDDSVRARPLLGRDDGYVIMVH
jgi:hypothetical protein